MTTINKIEIKPGMGIFLNDTSAKNLYVVIPTTEGLAVISYGEPRTWLHMEDFLYSHGGEIVAIHDIPCRNSITGKLLWEKPKKVILTLQEIADKLNVPLRYLCIEGINSDKFKLFSSDEIKPGMIVEISQHDKTISLGMVTYGIDNCLCISGPSYWAPLNTFNRILLCTHTGDVITKVYSQASNRLAYTLSTEGRQLLWDRRYTRLYNLRDIANAFGVPMDQIEIRE